VQTFRTQSCDGKHLKRSFNAAVTELVGGPLSESARRARTPIAQRRQGAVAVREINPQQKALTDAAAALAALWQRKR
jgi:hypothetical protein